MFLLDTNIVSALLREPSGAIAKRTERVDPDLVFVNLIVLGELKYGALKRGSVRLTERVDGVIRRLAVLPFRSPIEERFAETRTALERRGMPISMNDLWIAAHALAEGATLVTANEREFSRVPGLRLENWLAD